MGNDKNILFKIAVSNIRNIGPITARNLIAYTGSVESVFKEKISTLSKIPGMSLALAKLIKSGEILKKAETELEFINKYDIKTLFFLDDDYPYRLKECQDSPVLLYYKGKINFNADKIISIVGTRNATDYGKNICDELIKDLSEGHKPVIVSGLAYGIDVCAHRSALKYGLDTIACLGHGLDIIYPAIHKNTAKRIINQGALLTEYTSFSKRDPKNFVKRNRIIAGLSDATIVIESAIKGGAIITADIANSYNRDVFATPGDINNPFSQGCNRLIKTNRAALIEGVNDLEYILNWKKVNTPSKQKIIIPELTKTEKTIIEILKNEKIVNIDFLTNKLEINLSETSLILLELEFKNLIKSLPGKTYKLHESIITDI